MFVSTRTLLLSLNYMKHATCIQYYLTSHIQQQYFIATPLVGLFSDNIRIVYPESQYPFISLSCNGNLFNILYFIYKIANLGYLISTKLAHWRITLLFALYKI